MSFNQFGGRQGAQFNPQMGLQQPRRNNNVNVPQNRAAWSSPQPYQQHAARNQPIQGGNNNFAANQASKVGNVAGRFQPNQGGSNVGGNKPSQSSNTNGGGVQARLGGVAPSLVRTPITAPKVLGQANKPTLIRAGQEKKLSTPETIVNRVPEKKAEIVVKPATPAVRKLTPITAPSSKAAPAAAPVKPEPIVLDKKALISATPVKTTLIKATPVSTPTTKSATPASSAAVKVLANAAVNRSSPPVNRSSPNVPSGNRLGNIAAVKPAVNTAVTNRPSAISRLSNPGPNQSGNHQPLANRIDVAQSPNDQSDNSQAPNNQTGNLQGPNSQTGDRQAPNNKAGNREGPNNEAGNREGPNSRLGNRQGFNNQGGDAQGSRQGFNKQNENRRGPNSQNENRRGPNNELDYRQGSDNRGNRHGTSNESMNQGPTNVSNLQGSDKNQSGAGHWQSQGSGNNAKMQGNDEGPSKPMPLMGTPIMNPGNSGRNERHSRFEGQRDFSNDRNNPQNPNNTPRQDDDKSNFAGNVNPAIVGRLGPREEEPLPESSNKYMKSNNQQRVRGGNFNQWNEESKKQAANNRPKPRQGYSNNRDQADGGRDFRRDGGGRGRGGYGQDKFWERLFEIRGEQYELEPLNMAEKQFNAQARLFAGSLSRETTLEEIKEMFSKFGELGQVYHNKEGAYAFVNFDYRANAEKAMRELHGTSSHGRTLMIRFAAITTGVRVKNLAPTVTNELLYKAFSVFGVVELCRVIVDDRGKPTGDGIIIFTEKKPAVMAFKKCQEESYFLTNQLRPVIVEPWETRDDEEGFPESSIQKNENYRKDRKVGPRFAEPSSYESDYGKRWKQLFDIYKEKKLALENDLKAEMEALEVKMQLVAHQQETEKLRKELAQREYEAMQLQRGLGNFSDQIRPTQLTSGSNDYPIYGAPNQGMQQGMQQSQQQQQPQQGVKRPYEQYNQQQGRDYYGESYPQGGANNFNNAAVNAGPRDQQRQRQPLSYANVVSGVSGASYDRVDTTTAPVAESSVPNDESVKTFNAEVAPADATKDSARPSYDATPTYGTVPAGQQQTIETYTRQENFGGRQQNYDFDAPNKRGRFN